MQRIFVCLLLSMSVVCAQPWVPSDVFIGGQFNAIGDVMVNQAVQSGNARSFARYPHPAGSSDNINQQNLQVNAGGAFVVGSAYQLAYANNVLWLSGIIDTVNSSATPFLSESLVSYSVSSSSFKSVNFGVVSNNNSLLLRPYPSSTGAIEDVIIAGSISQIITTHTPAVSSVYKFVSGSQLYSTLSTPPVAEPTKPVSGLAVSGSNVFVYAKGDGVRFFNGTTKNWTLIWIDNSTSTFYGNTLTVDSNGNLYAVVDSFLYYWVANSYSASPITSQLNTCASNTSNFIVQGSNSSVIVSYLDISCIQVFKRYIGATPQLDAYPSRGQIKFLNNCNGTLVSGADSTISTITSASSSWSDLTVFSNPITAIECDNERNSLYVSTVPSVQTSTNQPSVYKIQLISQPTPQLLFPATSLLDEGAVNTITQLKNGVILVGGAFSYVGPIAAINAKNCALYGGMWSATCNSDFPLQSSAALANNVYATFAQPNTFNWKVLVCDSTNIYTCQSWASIPLATGGSNPIYTSGNSKTVVATSSNLQKVYFAGAWTASLGSSSAYGVLSYDSVAQQWSSLGISSFSGRINALYVTIDNFLVVGGQFSFVAPTTTTTSSTAQFKNFAVYGIGEKVWYDQTLNVCSDASCEIFAFASYYSANQETKTLYIGGYITGMSSGPTGVIQYDVKAGTVSALAPIIPISTTVYSLSVAQNPPILYAGGALTNNSFAPAAFWPIGSTHWYPIGSNPSSNPSASSFIDAHQVNVVLVSISSPQVSGQLSSTLSAWVIILICTGVAFVFATTVYWFYRRFMVEGDGENQYASL